MRRHRLARAGTFERAGEVNGFPRFEASHRFNGKRLLLYRTGNGDWMIGSAEDVQRKCGLWVLARPDGNRTRSLAIARIDPPARAPTLPPRLWVVAGRVQAGSRAR